jgi:hypothetical protein
MLDLAVSVLHIFSILLPEKARSDTKFINRIPLLVSSVLYRYGIISTDDLREQVTD